MFGRRTVTDFINRSAQSEADRRNFLRSAGLAGLGVAGAATLGTVTASSASASPESDATDAAVLNFALNLEYLEAEFYLRAVYGTGLPNDQIDGTGTLGGVTGGHKVPFTSKVIAAYAKEIAQDEFNHVKFLRTALGTAHVARPEINFTAAFTGAARAAKLIGPNDTVDPFSGEDWFLLAAFLFEDVGVTAYKGAAPLVTNKTYLEAAAGILGVEAYHAGIVRTTLYMKAQQTPVLIDRAQKISDLRDALDGPTDDDQGLTFQGGANLVPTDPATSIAYSREAASVLNIVYGTPKSVSSGLFYPRGVNGPINTSAANG